MHQRLMELTATVEQAGQDLLNAYTAKQLYAFRVSVRRIRSILKQIDSHRSRQFRKIWGGFAAVTNAARDWDVFLDSAQGLLAADDYHAFRALNQARVRHHHEAATGMLGSTHWQRHLEEWKDLLARSDDRQGMIAGAVVSLDDALARARRALVRALEIDDDHSWHKFRIRVKEVRYQAEAVLADAPDRGFFQGVISSCKQMQTLLGDWHDTVVQLNLLDELEFAPVHETLSGLIAERKKMFLDQIRQVVRGHPLFGAGASPA